MDHTEVFLKIVSLLQGLDREAQVRVLASVQTLLDLSPPQPSVRVSPDREPPEKAAVKPHQSSFSQDRAMSAKEFLRDKDPQTDIERVACLAYYLSHYRNAPHFKTVDISALNIEAAQPKFSNAAYSVENARSSGLLVAAVGGNKQLSAIGERYVEELPNRDSARALLRNAKAKRRSAR